MENFIDIAPALRLHTEKSGDDFKRAIEIRDKSMEFAKSRNLKTISWYSTRPGWERRLKQLNSKATVVAKKFEEVI